MIFPPQPPHFIRPVKVLEVGLSQQFIPEVLISSSAIVLDSQIRVINVHYKLGLDKEIADLTQKVVNLKGSSRLA